MDANARRGKITQEDIANACKIDQGSVSRILNKDTRDSFAPETVAEACGIDAATIRRIARELAGAPRAAVYGRIGTCTQEYGTLASWLIDVVNVDDVTRDQHVERELLLIKLRVPAAQIAALAACVQKAGGKVLSDDAESYTVEVTDSEAQINRFIAESGNFGEVLEVVRSGALAILRGATTLRA